MKDDNSNNVPFGPINMRRETWIKYAYMLSTVEHSFVDIRDITDKEEKLRVYQEIVHALGFMTAALQVDLIEGDIPENVTIQ